MATRILRLLGALCAVALAACGVPKEQHAKIVGDLKTDLENTRRSLDGKTTLASSLTSDLDKCRAKAKELDGQLGSAKEDFFKAKGSIGDCYKLIKGKAGEVATLAQEVRDKEAELAKRDTELKGRQEELKSKEEAIAALRAQVDRLRSIFTDLEQKLDSLVKSGKLTVKMRQGLLVVQLPERILFPSGSHKLKKEGIAAVESISEILKTMKHRWQVAGHTDDVGRAAFNWALSSRRARAVLNVMLESGMPAEQVSAAGFGQYQPIAPNDNDDNRSQNRRTELLLVPDLSELLAPIRATTTPTGA